MKMISSLNSIHVKGKFGDFENKNEKDLLSITEIKDVTIFQIVKFKNSKIEIDKIQIDNLFLPNSLKSSVNSNTRILWIGPNNWLVFSLKLDLFLTEKER